MNKIAIQVRETKKSISGGRKATTLELNQTTKSATLFIHQEKTKVQNRTKRKEIFINVLTIFFFFKE